MSKSLGNSPDPLDMIAEYGADGVRTAMLFCSAAGNDLMFDESLCEQGRNFGNKIWNAYRLVNTWKVDDALPQPESARIAVEWFGAVLDKAVGEIDRSFASYHISEALMTIYKLFWDDFSAWYLEMIKPAYQQPIDGVTLTETRAIFGKLLQVIHPFMPFITEEIWQHIAPRRDGESIMVTLSPRAGAVNETLLAEFEKVQGAITAIRSIRQERGIANKDAIVLRVIPDENYHPAYNSLLAKMANLSSIDEVAEKDASAAAFIVKTTQYFVPMGDRIDVAAELEKLTAELTYLEGFLRSVMGKLGNERFMAGAPAKVVETELAKKADAEAKIAAIRERIAALK